ncbi:hypothetical protein ACWT_4144 [Actinoplanes sp. SE50]|uniref:hypothetical protein n=1 Tax=unclassified Actinoplanes TaxID=2626549 RepID=UPI00023EC0EF|nr:MULTISPECIES: hypothetical protein [unclassified Actinoplanes]AEV85166.1 hypothetical protein ACPL_4273 [Actinoplanes sp. SE50/110]ATO83559.1 hypothetical protein ACWT_4144 [Actinoplanes sp. SE50]SLM00966.1 hypothetical protein ACSP50_4199 [Actinoplanes sp. SE50/110]
MTAQRTVVFVCPHGAGKSRIAAAWFNGLGLPGWTATSAGMEPQQQVSVHAARLLQNTPVLPLLDEAMPRPLSAVPERDLLVAIDCSREFPADHRWDLEQQQFTPQMCTEIRDRVQALAAALAGQPS